MSYKKTLEVHEFMEADLLACEISNMYMEWENYRGKWLNDKRELRQYLFATDTRDFGSTLSVWKNSTHIPKLCQIRDNLHANYMSALFPQDRSIKWEGQDRTSVTKKKRQAIEAYMNNKIRTGGFIPEVEKCVHDFIDFGNAFALVEYVSENHVDTITGETIQGYQGPKVRRISPLDIVFNPLAATFEETPKIVRSLCTLGDLRKQIRTNPEKGYLEEIFTKLKSKRHEFSQMAQGDNIKDTDFVMSGFSSFKDYMQSQYVEVLDFYGDVYDSSTDTLYENHLITIVDRSYILRKEPNPSWLGNSSIRHVGWRVRQDNLYAMGPLDNLVGMQYRIDHLENAKADGFDLIIHPVLKVRGYVEDFDYAPNSRIYVGDEGDVEFMSPDGSVLTADTQIALYEQKMEEMAGAPKQAMGFRTPGEKTAFEVQILENGANKVFLNKTSYFERVFLEPLLNSMLETSRRLMGPSEQVQQIDQDFNVSTFKTITKEDITASGKIVPVGARHFARNANLLQSLVQLMNTPAMQDPNIRSHISGKKIAKLFEELLDLDRFELVRDNIMVEEQFETQRLAQQAGEILNSDQQGVPTNVQDQDQMATRG